MTTGFIPLSTVDPGTEMLFIPMNQEQESHDEYMARFSQTTGYTSFIAESKQLYDLFNEHDTEPYFTVQFIHAIKQKRCGFSSVLKDTIIKRDSFYVNVDQISPIQQTSIRKAERHNISIPVNIYKMLDETRPGELILSSTTFDLSTGGLCVLTTVKLALEKDAVVLLELTFNKNTSFKFHANLIRNVPCTKTSQYKYEYGFIFDIKETNEDKSKLISAVLDHKLSSFR